MAKSKRRRSPGIIIGLSLLGIVLGLIVAGILLHKTPQPIIRTARVKRGAITSSVSANGILQPLTVVQVKSNAAGQVVQLLVDAGSVVKKGQVIARIDPATSLTALQEAKADYDGSNAALRQSQEAADMERPQDLANIASAEQSLEADRQKLLQAEKSAFIQPGLTVAAIKQAEGDLADANAALRQTKTALSPQKIAAAQSAYDQAKANYVLAQKNLARQKALLDKGFVSTSTVEAAQQQFDVAHATQDNAMETLQTVKGQTEEDERQAQAKVDQAQAALNTAEINTAQDELKAEDMAAARATVKQAVAALVVARAAATQTAMKGEAIIQSRASLEHMKASVQEATTQLNYTTVTAPCSGIVVQKYVEVGSIVTAGGLSALGSGTGVELVDISDNNMTVMVNVDETDIAQIRFGQPVDITVDAFPDAVFSGKVTKIAPEAAVDQNVTSIPVTVEITTPDLRLKPNMNATCDFIVSRKQNVLSVPNEAVTDTGSGHTVTVLDHQKQIVRHVTIGLVGNDATEILSGLQEGDTVVTSITQPTSTTAMTGGGGPPGGRMR